MLPCKFVAPEPAQSVRHRVRDAVDVRSWAVLLIVLLLSGALFLFRSGGPSFWYDEAFSIQVVSNGLTHMHAVAQGTEVYMLLYYGLLRWWLELGTSELTVRLLSALFAMGAVAATWLLARRLFDARVAALAAVLLAMNAMVIAYAQEARTYALLLLLTTFATYALVVALESGQRRWWISYVVTAALVPYAHLAGALVLVAQAIAVLGHPDRPSIRSLSIVALAIGLAVTPLALAVVASGAGGIGWVSSLDASTVGLMATQLAGGGNTGQTIPAWTLLVVYVVLAVAGTGSLLRQRRPTTRWSAVLLVSWLVLPIVVLGVASVVKPLLVTRYLIEITPPLAILAAVALSRIARLSAFVVALVALLVLAAAGDWTYYGNPGKPGWRPATEYVAQHSSAHDRWISYESWAWRPMALYADMLHPQDGFPLRLWRDLDSSASDFSAQLGRVAAELAAEERDIWVVAPPSSRAAIDPATSPVFAPLRESYEVANRQVFDGSLVVVQFVPRSSG